MTNFKKMIFLFVIFSLLIITAFIWSSSDNINTRADILGVADEVDIWNSVQYEIITDMDIIKSIDSKVTNDVNMFRFKIRLENRGSKAADNFRANLKYPAPMSFINASMNQGTDTGKLKPDDTYEVTGYYTFDSKEKMNEFIEQSFLLVEWTEKENDKQLGIRFSSFPTQ